MTCLIRRETTGDQLAEFTDAGRRPRDHHRLMSASGSTRRGFIGGAAAGVATGLLPLESAQARSRPRTRRADVVVVGAGLAGLTAARRLVKAGKSVIVLEARSRVGGRVVNQPIGRKLTTDGGAAFVGPTQDRILALIHELGLKTFKTYNTGDNIYFREGQRQRYTAAGEFGPIPPDPGVLDAAAALSNLDQMATQLPVAAPWNAPKAGEWDGQTLETWTQANLTTAGGRFLIDVATEPMLGVSLSEPSLLFMLWYIACAGNAKTPGTLERLANTGDGAQESHISGGAALIPERVAHGLGKRVLLGTPVRRIAQAGRGVRAEADSLTVTAKRAIVAVPPLHVHGIEFDPQLPPAAYQLAQRMPMGILYKVSAVYAKPFWRDEGLTGQAVSDTGPGRTTFDTSPADGSAGVLLAFVGADDARAWQGKPSSKLFNAVLQSFARYFGDQALHPRSQAIMAWPLDPWTLGAPTAFTPPGVLSRYGSALAKPVGRVHWAGTETATYWRGYMDGAVSSGERAADEVLARL